MDMDMDMDRGQRTEDRVCAGAAPLVRTTHVALCLLEALDDEEPPVHRSFDDGLVDEKHGTTGELPALLEVRLGRVARNRYVLHLP